MTLAILSVGCIIDRAIRVIDGTVEWWNLATAIVDMNDFTSVTVKSTPNEVEEIRMKMSNPLNQTLSIGFNSISTATYPSAKSMGSSKGRMKSSN